jgi:hypothetical protein
LEEIFWSLSEEKLKHRTIYTETRSRSEKRSREREREPQQTGWAQMNLKVGREEGKKM